MSKGIIYLIVIKNTFHQYIGMTRNSLFQRIKQHLSGNQIIDDYMRKYGFKVYVLERCPREMLPTKELEYISLFQTDYNLKFGGLNKRLTIQGEPNHLMVNVCKNGFSKKYMSIQGACCDLGLCCDHSVISMIKNCCKHNRTYLGYTWSYS